MLEFRPLTIAFVLVALLCGKAQATSFEAATDQVKAQLIASVDACLLYTSPSPRDGLLSRMPSSA